MTFCSESSSTPKSENQIVRSNLKSFLDSVTLLVPSKTLHKEWLQDIRLWNPLDKDEIEYFTLQDMWECFEDWSAYGLGVPVVLDNGKSVLQYYTPYLSALQIYTNKPKESLRDTRGSSGETPSDDQSSTGESGSDTWDATSGESGSDQGGSGSSSPKNRLGYLYVQYHETNSPFWRIPLVEKVAELSDNYPGLMSLNTIDLSPASWMSIAWYPIYHVPRTMKELSTCFLTFHTLSSTFQDDNGVDRTENYDVGSPGKVQPLAGTDGSEEVKGRSRVSVPPFGLASYRMQPDVWLTGDPLEHLKVTDLYNASDSWLKQLCFWHHDFEFFSTHDR